MLVTMGTQRVKNRKDAKFVQDLSKTNKDVAPQKSQPVQQAFPVASQVIAQKLEREQKKGEGEGRRETLPSPIIPFFFCSLPNVLDEFAQKCLLCRLQKLLSFTDVCTLKGGQVGAPTKQMSVKFCGFWSSIFAHFNGLLSDLVTFKVSYSSLKAIFPAV